jgi:hypothetical protein
MVPFPPANPGAIPVEPAIPVTLTFIPTGVPATGATLTATPASPQSSGAPVAFTATGAGGSGTYEYQFSDNVTGVMAVTRPYSVASDWIWNTTGVPNGSYSVMVDVRSLGSTSLSEASATVGYTIEPATVPGVTLAASPASPIVGGDNVAFTATAAGTGPYEYQFMGRLAGQATFSLAQPYGPSNVFNWNTAGILSGTYEIQVQVRHVGAAVPFEATQSLNYTVTTPVATGVTITASPASPQLPGTNVTFTANATGGGVYEYQFIGRLVGSPVFSVARNYDPINTWTWDTTGVAPGNYEIVVLARAAGSTAAFEATATIFYTVSASTIAVSLGATPPSPATAGSSVTFTATATPAGGNYEYQFLGRRVGDPAFSIAQTYGPSNTWIWGSVAGSWEMQVQVRNVGSAEPFEAQQTIVYTVN